MPDLLDQLASALHGSYTIERHIGRGGMASVYLAQDLKHHRKVAIKVLLPELATVIGAERFLREIETAANLTHPHILPLYDSGQTGGQPGLVYYVMPYVEGESLRDRLEREGQLSVEDTVRIAREVADGLSHAHSHDVVHRDIKPENILLSGEHALIADFGIARAVSAAGSRLTETGLSLGTPEYMSPEQASGSKQVDVRSDLYSLGCVVYEMLVGEPPHTGPNPQAIIAKVLQLPAPLVSTSRKTVPPNVDQAVAKALARLPADRFTSAHEFAKALGPITAEGVVPGVQVVQRRLIPWPVLASAAIVVMAVAALGVFWLATRESEQVRQPVSRFAVQLPTDRILRTVLPEDHSMLEVGLFGSAVAISPDGSQVVYVARQEGATQLFLRRIDELEAHPIPGTEGARAPFFSSDGEWVGFYAGRELRKVDVIGRSRLTVAGIDVAIFGTSWGQNDTIVLGHCTNGLERVAASGGEREVLTRVDYRDPHGIGRQHQFPELLPGNEWVLFTVFNSAKEMRIDALSLKTGQRHTVVDYGTYARYLPSGHLVYALDGNLMAAPFDLATLRLTSSPFTVLSGVLMESDRGAAHYSVSDNGTLVYLPGEQVTLSNTELVWVDHDGTETPLPLPPAQTSIRLSPVGDRILVSRPLETGGSPDLWVYDLAARTQSRLTAEETEEWWGVWTTDGERVVFSSTRSGRFNLYRMPWDGSSPAERLTETEKDQLPYSVSPDGSTLAYVEAESVFEQADIWTMPLEGDRTPRPFLQTPANEIHPAFSPDGRWMAYTSNESGRFEVYLRPYPGPGAARRISNGLGHQPIWSSDGEALYYRAGNEVWVVPIQTSPELIVSEPRVLFEGPYSNTRGQWGRMYDLSPDGKRFLMLKVGDPPPAPTQYNIVLNWFEELERLVGPGVK